MIKESFLEFIAGITKKKNFELGLVKTLENQTWVFSYCYSIMLNLGLYF